MTHSRHVELQQMLEQRHRELAGQVQTKVRGFREIDASDAQRRDEFSEDQAHEDIDFALVQMQSQTMEKIAAALARLDSGDYGICRECEGEIAEKRLRALPFASRCKTCQESAEYSEGHERRALQRDATFRMRTLLL
jgi:DnaK suppressor protein